MGMFDTIEARCPTPDCQGRLSGQTKAGDCMLNTYEAEGEIDAYTAHIVRGETLTCPACGCEAVVEVDEPAKVTARVVVSVPGDVTRTVRVDNFSIEHWPSDEPQGQFAHIHRMKRRREGDQSVGYKTAQRDEYMAHQERAGISGTSPVNFDYDFGGVHYKGRTWHHFREREKSGAV